jgi:hypothetical protein
VSFGVDPANGRRLRRKTRGRTQELVANKVRALERERDAEEWPDALSARHSRSAMAPGG